MNFHRATTCQPTSPQSSGRYSRVNEQHGADLANGAGFGPPAIAQMPANNLAVLFRRTG